MQQQKLDIWNKRIRIAFWIIGTALGVILTYTTRYYVNSDGINYVEMGEQFRQGLWSGLINTTESPGYAFLLGIGQLLLNTNPLNEIPLLKIVNLVCFLFTMAICDLFVVSLKNRTTERHDSHVRLLPFPIISALAYGMFLYMALGWIRVRVIAPDMMVFAWFLVAAWAILRTRDQPESYVNFVVLGVAAALAYYFKTFFFLYSPVLFFFAGLASGSLKRAIPRLAVALGVMQLLALPLLAGLSEQVGHFSYGEVGNFGYVHNLAGEGTPIHQPIVLNSNPSVLSYRDGPGKTCPAGYDLAYWTLGMKKVFDASIHWRVLKKTVVEFFGYISGLLAVIIVWLLIQLRVGSLSVGGWRPLSIQWLLMLSSLPGIGIYVLMHVEPRYLAPFVFLTFIALTLLPRYKAVANAVVPFTAVWSSALLILFILVGTVQSAVDQTYRGLFPQKGKISHYQMYQELFAVKDFLNNNGVGPGAEVAVTGYDNMPPVYWARLGKMRITAGIPNEKEFLQADPQSRSRAVKALKDNGVRALLTKGSFITPFLSEGWRLVPNTVDYYVIFP